MSTRRYEGPGRIFYDGQPLAESSSVRAAVNSNNQIVRTMQRGVAGNSKGATESRLTIESAIPLDGLERDVIGNLNDNKPVRVVMAVATERLTFDGWVDSYEISTSVDQPASISMEIVAGPPQKS